MFYLTNATKSVPLQQLPEEAWQTLIGSDGYSSTVDAYKKIVFIFRGVELRSNAVSTLPRKLFMSGDSKKVDVSPKYPNLLSKIKRLLWLTEASLSVYGCSYLIKEENRSGIVYPRWLVPSSITPKYDTSGLVSFTRAIGANKTDLPIESVIYFWRPSLTAEIGYGISPVSVALEAASIISNIDGFASGYFKRGVIKATLLTVEGNPKEEELIKLQAWWKRLVGGIKKAYETIAIRASVKPVVIGDSLKETLAPELSLQKREDIAIALGIPLSLIQSNAANFATAQQDALNFYNQTVIPEAELIAEVLNEQLFYEYGLTFEFMPEQLEVFQASELAKADALSKVVGQPILTVNEGRATLGLEPLAVVRSKSAYKAEPVDDGNIEDRLSIERKAITKILVALRLQQDDLLNGDLSVSADVIASRIEVSTPELAKALLYTLTQGVELGIETAITSVPGIVFDASGVNTAALQWARNYAGSLIKDINQTTLDLVRSKVANWIETGEPLDALIDSLSSVFGRSRAETIAVTEVTRSYAEGNLLVWRDTGIIDRVLWRTAEDELVCPVCRPLANKPLSLASPEVTPPAHVRCRCWLVPKVDL